MGRIKARGGIAAARHHAGGRLTRHFDGHITTGGWRLLDGDRPS